MNAWRLFPSVRMSECITRMLRAAVWKSQSLPRQSVIFLSLNNVVIGNGAMRAKLNGDAACNVGI